MGSVAEEEAMSNLAGSEERILVFIHVRPMNEKELTRNDMSEWECTNDTTIMNRNNLSATEMFLYPARHPFGYFSMEENEQESRPLTFTPTWSIATVLSIFVGVSLLVEHAIHYLTSMMLLGFISLLLTATSEVIANICIPLKFYNSDFARCTRSEIEEATEKNGSKEHKLLMVSTYPHLNRRILEGINRNSCNEGYEPFVSYEGLEQLHRFIFVMAVTHISYSCLTMLLSIVKIHSWRMWENEAHKDRHSFFGITRHLAMQNQSTLVMFHRSNPLVRNTFINWVVLRNRQMSFLRQFWNSVGRTHYLTLSKGFIMNHNLTLKYDFHSYVIQSMEEDFQMIVGVSVPLWGFVVAFMLFNIKGSNLYLWIAFIPNSLVLLIGTKLQHVIATLVLENAEITGFFSEAKLTPRDELFWFNKPELLLSLIHFILFQNSFELASFFWFWWQFGYNSCIIRNHLHLYLKLILGFAGQFLCSYSTLPLYALVTQMGTNFKAALIPEHVRDTIDYWGKATRRKRRHGKFTDGFELQPLGAVSSANRFSCSPVTPLLQQSASDPSAVAFRFRAEKMLGSYSLPKER